VGRECAPKGCVRGNLYRSVEQAALAMRFRHLPALPACCARRMQAGWSRGCRRSTRRWG